MTNFAKLKLNQWYYCEEYDHSTVRKKYFFPWAEDVNEDSFCFNVYNGLYFSAIQYPDGTSEFRCYDDERVYLDGTENLVPCEPPIEVFRQFTEECAQRMFNANRC